MRPLVAVRRSTPWNPWFASKSPLFWPLASAISRLELLDDFPSASVLSKLYGDRMPVRIEALVQGSRGPRGYDRGTHYDARIVESRTLPTRERCWHDLMNALVWASFPRSKLALHVRQHAAVLDALSVSSPSTLPSLPPQRTRPLDALALLDEGGVLRLDVRDGDSLWLLFGHALYEHLALGAPPPRASVARLEVNDARPRSAGDLVFFADLALSRALGPDSADFLLPDALARVDLANIPVPSATGTW